MSEEHEKYYCGLGSANGYRWSTFLSWPRLATADETGYVAVSQSFDTQGEAQDYCDMLNYSMFRIEAANKEQQE